LRGEKHYSSELDSQVSLLKVRWCGSDDIWVPFRLCSARIDLTIYHIYSRVLRVCVRACATTVKKTVSAFCSSSRSFHA